MKCYECDGEGVIYDDLSFDFAVCEDCDGYGEEYDWEPGEEIWVTDVIERYQNRRGFYRYYTVDFQKRKTTLGIEFVWRTRKWKIIDRLPTFGMFNRMWGDL